MKEYDEISNEYRYGKVRKEFWDQHIQKKIKEILAYLKAKHSLEIEGIYLENYRSPEPIIVVNGPLPVEEIENKFGHDASLEYKENKVISSDPWVIIEGIK